MMSNKEKNDIMTGMNNLIKTAIKLCFQLGVIIKVYDDEPQGEKLANSMTANVQHS
jgi:hypothetical protein